MRSTGSSLESRAGSAAFVVASSGSIRMHGRSTLASWFFQRRLDDDAGRIWRYVLDHPETVVLGLGVLLRFVVYLHNRPFWMDEGSLFDNLAGKPVLDFSEGLGGDQLAPIGFLIAQRALIGFLGRSTYAARLLPLVCGITALFLFRHLARRVLSRRPALVALVLFAFSDDLIYYSSELKPYSLDLAIGLALGLGALDCLAKPLSLRRAAVMGLAAIAAPWLSFASAFAVAGCGATLIFSSLSAGRYRDALIWGTIAIGWIASFAVSYHASSLLLSPYTTMYVFWNFAFLPIWPWPISPARLAETAGILLEVFVNPLNLVAPLWPQVGVALPLVLLIAGGLSLARKSLPIWAILVLPIALAIVASAMKRYPFHGRLILELVPTFFLMIAQGTEWLRGIAGGRHKLGYRALLGLLLAYPCIGALQEAAAPSIREFNSHGDLHKNIFIE
jgi:hypothetical protein